MYSKSPFNKQYLKSIQDATEDYYIILKQKYGGKPEYPFFSGFTVNKHYGQETQSDSSSSSGSSISEIYSNGGSGRNGSISSRNASRSGCDEETSESVIDSDSECASGESDSTCSHSSDGSKGCNKLTTQIKSSFPLQNIIEYVRFINIMIESSSGRQLERVRLKSITRTSNTDVNGNIITTALLVFDGNEIEVSTENVVFGFNTSPVDRCVQDYLLDLDQSSASEEIYNEHLNITNLYRAMILRIISKGIYNHLICNSILSNLIGDRIHITRTRMEEQERLKTIFHYVHFHHFYDNSFISNQDAFIIQISGLNKHLPSSHRRKTIKIIHIHHYHVYKESHLDDLKDLAESSDFIPLSKKNSDMIIPGSAYPRVYCENPSNAHSIVKKKYGILVYESFVSPPHPSPTDNQELPSICIPAPPKESNHDKEVEITLKVNNLTVSIKLTYNSNNNNNNNNNNNKIEQSKIIII